MAIQGGCRRVFAAGALLLCLCCCPAAQAQVVFDSISGAAGFEVPNQPRTNLGQAFNINPAYTVQPLQLWRADVVVAAVSAVSYTNTRVRLQFWDTYNPAAVGATPVFSNPVGPVQVLETGALTVAANTAYTFSFVFPQLLTFSSHTNLGVSVNWQEELGGGLYADTNNLTVAIRAGGSAPPTVGSSAFTLGEGYLRDVSFSGNFNFIAADYQNGAGANDGLMIRLTAIPEPTTWLLLGLGTCAAYPAYKRWRKGFKAENRAAKLFAKR